MKDHKNIFRKQKHFTIWAFHRGNLFRPFGGLLTPIFPINIDFQYGHRFLQSNFRFQRDFRARQYYLYMITDCYVLKERCTKFVILSFRVSVISRQEEVFAKYRQITSDTKFRGLSQNFPESLRRDEKSD